MSSGLETSTSWFYDTRLSDSLVASGRVIFTTGSTCCSFDRLKCSIAAAMDLWSLRRGGGGRGGGGRAGMPRGEAESEEVDDTESWVSMNEDIRFTRFPWFLRVSTTPGEGKGREQEHLR